eukprot:3169014-Amphidinium_carterae.1
MPKECEPCNILYSLQHGSDTWWLVIVDVVDSCASVEAHLNAREGAANWKHWTIEAVEKGAPQAHRWARRGRARHALMTRAGLEQHERFWWTLWQQRELPDMHLLATSPPQFVLGSLYEVLAQYPRTKAPGGDGWRIKT